MTTDAAQVAQQTGTEQRQATTPPEGPTPPESSAPSLFPPAGGEAEASAGEPTPPTQEPAGEQQPPPGGEASDLSEFDPSNPAAFVKAHPELESYIENRARTEANNAAARRENELRRQASTRENISAALRAALSDRESFRDGQLTEKGQQHIAMLLDLRERAATQETHLGWMQQFGGENYVVTEQAQQSARAALERVNPETGAQEPDWAGYYRAMIDGRAGVLVGEMSLSDVPANSKLRQELDAEFRRRWDAEVSSMQQNPGSAGGGRQRAPQPPPSTNGQAAPGSAAPDLNSFLGISRAVMAGQITEEEGARKMLELEQRGG